MSNPSAAILKARGGFLVDVEWEDGKFVRGRIHTTHAGRCRVSEPMPIHVAGRGMKKDAVQFETKPGGTYELLPLK